MRWIWRVPILVTLFLGLFFGVVLVVEGVFFDDLLEIFVGVGLGVLCLPLFVYAIRRFVNRNGKPS